MINIVTAGLREQEINVTQSWPGILKSLRKRLGVLNLQPLPILFSKQCLSSIFKVFILAVCGHSLKTDFESTILTLF